jgi:hypothetical protein
MVQIILLPINVCSGKVGRNNGKGIRARMFSTARGIAAEAALSLLLLLLRLW